MVNPSTSDQVPNTLKPVVEKYKEDGKPFKMGMVFPVSTHNYELALLAGSRWTESPWLLRTTQRVISPVRIKADVLAVCNTTTTDASNPGSWNDLWLLRR
jgi:hypothetical protein